MSDPRRQSDRNVSLCTRPGRRRGRFVRWRGFERAVRFGQRLGQRHVGEIAPSRKQQRLEHRQGTPSLRAFRGRIKSRNNKIRKWQSDRRAKLVEAGLTPGRGPKPNRCQPDPPARHDARKTSMGQTESSTLPHIEALRARRTGLIPRETFRCDQARILLLLTDPAARAFDFQSGTDAPDRPQGFSIPCKRTPAPPTRGQAPALRGGPRHRPKIEWR